MSMNRIRTTGEKMSLLKNFLINLTNFKDKRPSQMFSNRKQLALTSFYGDKEIDQCSTSAGGDDQYLNKDQQQKKKDRSRENIRLNCHDLKNSWLVDTGTIDEEDDDDDMSGQQSIEGQTPTWNNTDKMVNRNHNLFLKSWGNFVNLYDDQGREKLFIHRDELRNYIILNNFDNCHSPYSLMASLFPRGNYPKPLYSGTGSSWRMRYNIFAMGVLNPDKLMINDEDVIHLGELHLYFHIEPCRKEPIYQNLCFFFDQSLIRLLHSNEQRCTSSLRECIDHLRQELAGALFVEQIFFPITRDRFQSILGKTVDYFQLRQRDLYAAIDLMISQQQDIDSFIFQPNCHR
ncbi:uncharacterized protein LOC124498885 [Dermatophagoides farinae]|mgnify:CR=1 FL=1|uniref:Uncharacterized protein n=1 Tax=Dermatophagoides farinae TaxID=6954 RepID=A0A922HZG9_DERFA|nr:hypothetical protein HUG17_1489 [Dermatophagoides farinae]KAH9516232.1 hypothetical protein DERF_006986 [Dermatophagoides farinae]